MDDFLDSSLSRFDARRFFSKSINSKKINKYMAFISYWIYFLPYILIYFFEKFDSLIMFGKSYKENKIMNILK